MATPAHPPRPALKGEKVGTFAYLTIKDRLPQIVAKVVDHLYRTYSSLEETGVNAERIREAKVVIEELGRLRYEMTTDKPLTPIPADNQPDHEVWNRLLATEFPGATWFSATWLFSECYMYRRIYHHFAVTTQWRDFDFFAEQKESTFHASHQAVGVLADRVLALCTEAQSDKDPAAESRRVAFTELAQASLWGNRTDLSLLVNLNLADIHSIQSGTEDIADFVVVNQLATWWDRLSQTPADQPADRIDLVLDNSGFEVFVDMVLAHWLVVAGYCGKVVFHCKAIPWFVSDTTIADFHWVVDTCRDRFQAAQITDAAHLDGLVTLATQWQAHLDAGRWELQADSFWTSPYAFHHLPSAAPALFTDLQRSAAVVFKGDLNYRKLVYDCEWPLTTPFPEALGPLAQPGTALPVVALRTSKCDLMVGVAEGQAEQLDQRDSDWLVNGKFAVMEVSLPSSD
ncbi:Hairy/enhancer-of-split with YRPW motif protein 2 [Tieghemiomyces parasiticus]|uniref:Sugar phosphate phosphatase n=1 Tax=Tieghemiomyces parasiticus TaxID=78921 RepID=A0A9W8A144_9FUNG|nr:Hairy/enhancer-of-split with YRPW motif protein 2 [Tieghemiomyces parasiticus]